MRGKLPCAGRALDRPPSTHRRRTVDSCWCRRAGPQPVVAALSRLRYHTTPVITLYITLSVCFLFLPSPKTKLILLIARRTQCVFPVFQPRPRINGARFIRRDGPSSPPIARRSAQCTRPSDEVGPSSSSSSSLNSEYCNRRYVPTSS